MYNWHNKLDLTGLHASLAGGTLYSSLEEFIEHASAAKQIFGSCTLIVIPSNNPLYYPAIYG